MALGGYRPEDCVEARLANNESGVVTVYPEDTTLQVYCDHDTDGGGWLVFQRRQDGSVDFYRGWTEYQNGFGDPSAEFWLGLDALHTLTSKQSYGLRVDLVMWNGTKGHATYSDFSIGDSSDNYRMRFGTFTGGNAGDSMNEGKNQPFSTHDADHDETQTNCADYHHGAWWYNSCHDGQLNSRYKDSRIKGWDGVVWFGFDENYSLKFSEMKIRPL
ncbi:ficolin-1-like [Littorina saxatilis]|uniref:ficolin-1-like n=1 Tax=Littorina saxatilis TaxID=31220 RepID=UPI0038B54773